MRQGLLQGTKTNPMENGYINSWAGPSVRSNTLPFSPFLFSVSLGFLYQALSGTLAQCEMRLVGLSPFVAS